MCYLTALTTRAVLWLFACRHEYPQWRPQDLSRVFPSLEESGLELLRAMLQYDPARRISVSYAANAMSAHTCSLCAPHVNIGCAALASVPHGQWPSMR